MAATACCLLTSIMSSACPALTPTRHLQVFNAANLLPFIYVPICYSVFSFWVNAIQPPARCFWVFLIKPTIFSLLLFLFNLLFFYILHIHFVFCLPNTDPNSSLTGTYVPLLYILICVQLFYSEKIRHGFPHFFGKTVLPRGIVCLM